MNSLSAIKNDNYRSGKTMSVKNQKVRNSLFVFLFLLPALILFILFLVYPIFRSVYFSTFKWTGLGTVTNNIGLANYAKIFSDQVFLGAVKNILIVIVLSLAIQLPLAMARHRCGVRR